MDNNGYFIILFSKRLQHKQVDGDGILLTETNLIWGNHLLHASHTHTTGDRALQQTRTAHF
jgi:hypothetical protein